MQCVAAITARLAVMHALVLLPLCSCLHCFRCDNCVVMPLNILQPSECCSIDHGVSVVELFRTQSISESYSWRSRSVILENTQGVHGNYCTIAVHVWENGVRTRTCCHCYVIAPARTLRHQLGSASSSAIFSGPTIFR